MSNKIPKREEIQELFANVNKSLSRFNNNYRLYQQNKDAKAHYSLVASLESENSIDIAGDEEYVEADNKMEYVLTEAVNQAFASATETINMSCHTLKRVSDMIGNAEKVKGLQELYQTATEVKEPGVLTAYERLTEQEREQLAVTLAKDFGVKTPTPDFCSELISRYNAGAPPLVIAEFMGFHDKTFDELISVKSLTNDTWFTSEHVESVSTFLAFLKEFFTITKEATDPVDLVGKLNSWNSRYKYVRYSEKTLFDEFIENHGGKEPSEIGITLTPLQAIKVVEYFRDAKPPSETIRTHIGHLVILNDMLHENEFQGFPRVEFIDDDQRKVFLDNYHDILATFTNCVGRYIVFAQIFGLYEVGFETSEKVLSAVLQNYETVMKMIQNLGNDVAVEEPSLENYDYVSTSNFPYNYVNALERFQKEATFARSRLNKVTRLTDPEYIKTEFHLEMQSKYGISVIDQTPVELMRTMRDDFLAIIQPVQKYGLNCNFVEANRNNLVSAVFDNLHSVIGLVDVLSNEDEYVSSDQTNDINNIAKGLADAIGIPVTEDHEISPELILTAKRCFDTSENLAVNYKILTRFINANVKYLEKFTQVEELSAKIKSLSLENNGEIKVLLTIVDIAINETLNLFKRALYVVNEYHDMLDDFVTKGANV